MNGQVTGRINEFAIAGVVEDSCRVGRWTNWVNVSSVVKVHYLLR